MTTNYKLSKYNIVVKKTDETTTIYNSYSGGVCEFDKDSYQDLINLNTEGQYFSEMVKQGYIVPEEIDETQRIVEAHYKYIYNSTPEKMQFTIALTMSCPLNCYYCFENTHTGKIMSTDTADKITKYIIEAVGNNPLCNQLHISWFGGEPLLATDIIERIGTKLVEYCRNNNLTMTSKILTNGVLFDSTVFDTLYKKGILTSIQFTLDGDASAFVLVKGGTEDMFNTVLNAIKYTSQYIDTYVRMNVRSRNADDLLEVAENILKDVPQTSKLIFYAMPVVDYGLNEEAAKTIITESNMVGFRQDLVELLKKYNMYNYYVSHNVQTLAAFCSAMRLCNLTFGPDGEMYRCENLVGHKEYEIGDVNIGQYYNKVNYDLALAPIKQECLDCAYLPVCWGGCPVHANIYKQQFDCDGFKQNFVGRLLNRQ